MIYLIRQFHHHGFTSLFLFVSHTEYLIYLAKGLLKYSVIIVKVNILSRFGRQTQEQWPRSHLPISQAPKIPCQEISSTYTYIYVSRHLIRHYHPRPVEHLWGYICIQCREAPMKMPGAMLLNKLQNAPIHAFGIQRRFLSLGANGC